MPVAMTVQNKTTQEIPSGYKKADVGVIPEDWEVRSVNQIANPVRGGSPRPAGDSRFFDGSYIPWLTVAALTNIPASQLIVSETETYLTEEGSLRSRTLTPGILIIANSGATLGIAKILGIKCCANDGIAALLNLSKNVSPNYLAQFINTKTNYLREVVATGNGQPNLNTGLIGDFKIPLPPTKEEQEAIADALSDVDALIDSLQILIAKKNDLKQAAMQQLLAGQSRLPGFDGVWDMKVLGNIAQVMKGQGLSRGKLSQSGNFFCIHYGDLFTTYKEEIIEVYNKTDFREGIVSNSGDVLLPGSTTTSGIDLAKASALLVGDVLLGGDINIIRQTDDTYSPTFLAYCLTHIYKSEIVQRTKGITIHHLQGKDLHDLAIKMPKIDEQTAIAKVLSDMASEIVAFEQRLAKTRDLKQGMMQELLTGRIRLV